MNLVYLVKSNPGRPHSIQFQVLITDDQRSLNEYPTNKSNTPNNTQQEMIQIKTLYLPTILLILNKINIIERRKHVTEIAYKTMTMQAREEMA